MALTKMDKNDPYHDIKKYHYPKMMSQDGDVSPLCAVNPRKLNLRIETWTYNKTAITCNKCLKILANTLAEREELMI